MISYRFFKAEIGIYVFDYTNSSGKTAYKNPYPEKTINNIEHISKDGTDIAGLDCIVCLEHKMLTCTAALQLYEQGMYLMSDPVSKYMPEYEKMRLCNEELDKII